MRLEFGRRMGAITGGLSRMGRLAWFLAGVGSAIGLAILLAVWVDVAFIAADTPTISYRVLVATCWQPALAAVIAVAVVGPGAFLAGHLLAPQTIRPDGNGHVFGLPPDDSPPIAKGEP